jgi:hypothetical protein
LQVFVFMAFESVPASARISPVQRGHCGDFILHRRAAARNKSACKAGAHCHARRLAV